MNENRNKTLFAKKFQMSILFKIHLLPNEIQIYEVKTKDLKHKMIGKNVLPVGHFTFLLICFNN